jgi:shikimate kinase
MNYILIGLPGSGKSTIGVMLAKYIGFEFLDTDLVIQQKTGKKLSQLIEKLGPEGFLALENEICREVSVDNTVIATGGSAVYGEEAMLRFKETGKVIYLRMSCREMKRRLKNTFRKRGVVMLHGQTEEDLYNERVPLYERYADLVIDEQRCDSEQTLQKIISVIGEMPE